MGRYKGIEHHRRNKRLRNKLKIIKNWIFKRTFIIGVIISLMLFLEISDISLFLKLSIFASVIYIKSLNNAK